MSDTPIWDRLALEWKVDPSQGAAGVRASVDGQVLAARAAELGMSVLVDPQEGPREVTQHPMLQSQPEARPEGLVEGSGRKVAPKRVPSAPKARKGTQNGG